MLISYASTPENLREEILAFLDQRIREHTNSMSVKTQQALAIRGGRLSLLRSIRDDIKDLRIEPKT